MTIKLLNAHVLVKRDDPMTKTARGLLIPDSALRKSETGTVVSVGKFFFTNGAPYPFDIKEGDRIMFRKTDGEPLTVDGVDLTLLNLAHVIGIID